MYEKKLSIFVVLLFSLNNCYSQFKFGVSSGLKISNYITKNSFENISTNLFTTQKLGMNAEVGIEYRYSKKSAIKLDIGLEKRNYDFQIHRGYRWNSFITQKKYSVNYLNLLIMYKRYLNKNKVFLEGGLSFQNHISNKYKLNVILSYAAPAFPPKYYLIPPDERADKSTLLDLNQNSYGAVLNVGYHITKHFYIHPGLHYNFIPLKTDHTFNIDKLFNLNIISLNIGVGYVF